MIGWAECRNEMEDRGQRVKGRGRRIEQAADARGRGKRAASSR